MMSEYLVVLLSECKMRLEKLIPNQSVDGISNGLI